MKIDLRDEGVWAALERQAYDGTVNLLPLPPPAYKYFSELQAVYRAFRFEGMPKEDAENRKRLLRKAYDEQVSEIHRAREVFAEYQNAVRTAGTLTSEIEKSQSVFEIAERACKIIGLLTRDSSFYGRQIRKFTCEGIEIKKMNDVFPVEPVPQDDKPPSRQHAHNESDMLDECRNRLFITDNPDELPRLYSGALYHLREIYKYAAARLAAKKEATNENNT